MLLPLTSPDTKPSVLVAVFAGAVLVFVAATLRIIALTDKSLWFDETVSVLFAQQPLAQILALVGTNDPHPPLYYLLLHAWIGLFGSGEAALRALSVVLSTPAVLVTWLLGRRLLGLWPATVAALLVAVAPSQVAAGQEARMYGLLTLLAIGSWWALWGALGGNDEPGGPGGAPRSPIGAWVAYVAVTTAMLYTHYYGFFVVASQAAFLVWRGPTPAQWRSWVYAGTGVALLFLPWLPSFAQQLGTGRAWPAHRFPITLSALPDTFAAMTVGQPVLAAWAAQPQGQPPVLSGPAIVGFVAAITLAAAALRTPRIPYDRRVLLLTAALGPPILAFGTSLALNVFAPRYVLFIVPPLGLLVAAGVSSLAARARPAARAAAVALAALVLLPNALGTLAFYRQPRLDVFDWRLVARTLGAAATEGDAIVFLPGFSRIPVDYYFPGPQMRLTLTPQGTDVEGPDGARLPEVVARLAERRRVWVLTVPPVPEAVGSLVNALGRRSYEIIRQESINMVTLVLLERRQSDPGGS